MAQGTLPPHNGPFLIVARLARVAVVGLRGGK